MPSFQPQKLLLSVSLFIKTTIATPLFSKDSTESQSRALLFRVSAYSDIINRVRQSSVESYTQETPAGMKASQIGAIIGLTAALITVLAIASLVTAATLSILAFNKIYLRVIADSGTKEEREYAEMVLKLRKRPYTMICAFVFTGSAMAELIPLILSLIMQEAVQGKVGGELNGISILIAVLLVIVFVELLPLGYTVRKALFVNKFLIRFAEVLLVFWYPLTFPINYLFNKFYAYRTNSHKAKGKPSRFANSEERFFRNEELTRFVELHIKNQNDDGSPEGGDVHKSVVEILKGGFRLQRLNAQEVMLAWRNIHHKTEIFNMETKVTIQDGLCLMASQLEGALIMEIEDASDPDRQPDIDMLPMNGKKLRGFVPWRNFIIDIQGEECRAKFLTRQFMPMVFECFEDLLDLFSILHYGICKIALVVTQPSEDVRRNARPDHPEFNPSTTKVFWSNQSHIFACVKPIGVITYKSLLKLLLNDLSQSRQSPPHPMDRFKPERLNTQEKLALIDSMSSSNTQRSNNQENESTATGIWGKFMSLGTRRRRAAIVNERSPIRSSRGSLFDAPGEEYNTGSEKRD